MRNALRKCFPVSTLYACWFHFCQAVRKHANEIRGFVHDLKRPGNENATEIYCKFLCLPLLPAEAIVPAFDELTTEANNCDKKLFRNFLKYYTAQWIRKVHANYLLLMRIHFENKLSIKIGRSTKHFGVWQNVSYNERTRGL